jgi:uncharacterized protein (DUF608 family)
LKKLLQRTPQITYRGKQLAQIAFPLGGIGTGTVSLGGWGQLRDFEIMNRPARGFVPPHSFFTLKIERKDSQPLIKVLQGPFCGNWVGDGMGAPDRTGEGLPHFSNVSFRGEYPFAYVRLTDPSVPVSVVLEAFNPFIPLNDKDSSIPVAIFIYRFCNKLARKLKGMVYGNLTNIIGPPEKEGRINIAQHDEQSAGILFTTSKFELTSPRYGTMALATLDRSALIWQSWKDESRAKFWDVISSSNPFPPENGDVPTGTVGIPLELEPGETKTAVFLIAWHFPNFEQYWRKKKEKDGTVRTEVWKNYYAQLWNDAWDVVRYVSANFNRLYHETRQFHNVLFSSSLPVDILDAISSQLSVLRSCTCLRLPDGQFYGFEGCNPNSGCCEGSCTHVWNYAQALAYLFPSLQRSMLEGHFTNSMSKDGYIQFRMPLPYGTKANAGFVPAADGQMGLVIQTYREWLISGDKRWLKRIWPSVKKALSFAWKYWDADRDGIMEGIQHNTYDIEFWGPNTMIGSLYLCALRSAEEIARIVGDKKFSKICRKLFRSGARWTDKYLWNGEYYRQKVASKGAELWPAKYQKIYLDRGKDDRFPDWPRWQYGEGCLSDQLIGQWYATMLGLGYIYDRKHVRRALQSIFRYNWRQNLADHINPQRVYAVDDEAGLLVATWPHGGRPGYPSLYCDEVWSGIEYQVASHLIYEGFLKEGLTIVKAARERYRGDRRNPWDEIECGFHYARSLSSYALLLAFSGFRYSAEEQTIGFDPRAFQNNFRVFFCVENGWGMYSQELTPHRAVITMNVYYGTLSLRRLLLPMLTKQSYLHVRLADEKLHASIGPYRGALAVTFGKTVVLKSCLPLKIVISEKLYEID